MSLEGESAASVMDDMMLCAVCYEVAASDPVSMTCKAQHVFCFECIFSYFKSRAVSLESLSCPSCRHGNGSFLVMKRLKDLYKTARPRAVEENTMESAQPHSSQYFDSLIVLKNRFPRRFRHATDSCVVSASQMSLFVQNYDVLRELLGAGDLTVDMIEAKSWRGPDGRLLPRRTTRGPTRPRRAASRYNRANTGQMFIDIPFGDQGFMQTTAATDFMGTLIGTLNTDDVGIRRNPPRRARPSVFDDDTDEVREEDDNNEEVGEDTPFVNAVARFLASIGAGADTQEEPPTAPPPEDRGPRLPYNLRPRTTGNPNLVHSNEAVMQTWYTGLSTIVHIAILITGNRPDFRVSFSLSSARTFINTRIEGERSISKAFVVAMAVGRPSDEIRNCVVPILCTRTTIDVENDNQERLELIPVDDSVGIFDFLNNEFGSTDTSMSDLVWAIISEVNRTYISGALDRILCREILARFVHENENQ